MTKFQTRNHLINNWSGLIQKASEIDSKSYKMERDLLIYGIYLEQPEINVFYTIM
jgi:hypothetical protein